MIQCNFCSKEIEADDLYFQSDNFAKTFHVQCVDDIPGYMKIDLVYKEGKLSNGRT